MAAYRTWTLALIAVTLLGAIAWLVSDADAPAPADARPGSATPAQQASPAGMQTPVETGTAAEMRTEVVGDASEQQPTVADRSGLLRGRIVSDATGAPVAGATVVITRRALSEFRLPDTDERNAHHQVAQTVTDAEGRFEVAVPTAVPLDVAGSATGHATARRDHVFAGDDIELRLARAAILTGTLTLASDGSPVVGALVLGRDARQVEQCRAATDADGRFHFNDLQPGLLTVEITPRDAAVPPSKRVELRAGERRRLDLALAAGVRIHGVVSDVHGQPIAGAEVGLGASFQRAVRTDVQGHYEVAGIGGASRRDLGDLRARANGFGGERKNLAAQPPESTRIDFVLQRARIATGRVVDAEGEPIAGVYVAGVGSKTVAEESRSDWESTTTAPDGRFELANLHAQIDHQLFLRKDGYGTRVYDFPADEDQHRRIDYGDLVLHPAGRIEGVLTSQTGEPIPDHLVKLRGANADLGRFRPGAAALQKTWVTAVRHSRTDTHGRFHFADLPGGRLKVTAAVRGRPGANAEQSVDLPEGGEATDIALSLDLGTPITGVVRTPDGAPAIGVFVQVAGGPNRPRIRARSGAGGRFELLGVSEDMGVVELFTIVGSYNWYNADAQLGASRPTFARGGDSDVVLELRRLSTLTGVAVNAGGKPLADIQVLAYRNGAARGKATVLDKATTDAKGAFRLDLPEGCIVDLVPTILGKDKQSPLPATERIASDAKGVVLRIAH